MALPSHAQEEGDQEFERTLNQAKKANDDLLKRVIGDIRSSDNIIMKNFVNPFLEAGDRIAGVPTKISNMAQKGLTLVQNTALSLFGMYDPYVPQLENTPSNGPKIVTNPEPTFTPESEGPSVNSTQPQVVSEPIIPQPVAPNPVVPESWKTDPNIYNNPYLPPAPNIRYPVVPSRTPSYRRPNVTRRVSPQPVTRYRPPTTYQGPVTNARRPSPVSTSPSVPFPGSVPSPSFGSALRPGGGNGSYRPRITFDDSRPKRAPGGISMRIGITPATIQRSDSSPILSRILKK